MLEGQNDRRIPREAELGRRDPRDLHRLGVDGDAPGHDVRIGSEMGPPELVGEDRHPGRAGHVVLRN